MIRELTFPDQHLSLISQKWDNIPDLAVIAGLNGSGKSQLLNAIQMSIQSAGGGGAKPVTIAPPHQLKGRFKYVGVGFTPNNIVGQVNQTNPVIQLEARRSQLVSFLRGKASPPTYVTPLVQELQEELGPRIEEMTDEELVAEIPMDFSLRMQDYFDNTYIAEVFRDYLERVNRYKLAAYDAGQKSEVESEIYKKLGTPPPWMVINEYFEDYGFSYRINTPVEGVTYSPSFEDVLDNQLSVGFQQLSTGEQIIVSFILWAYNSKQKAFSELFLFDEIDAHLNPSLSHMMMNIIRDKIVDEFGIQVMMTTHSPSTVARTDDKYLFWMARNQPIRSATRNEIIPILSDGIITIAPNKALRIFSNVIGETTKPILCVEGETDKKILECAWQALLPDEEMPFEVHDVFDCYFITNLFKRGAIFQNYPDRTFIGLLDYDAAYKDLKDKFSNKSKKKVWTKSVDDNDRSVTYSHKNKRGIVTTLSVPDFRATYAGPEIRGSYLSIELLFEDELIAEYCDLVPHAGGVELLQFKDTKKTKFAEQVASFGADKFTHFEPLLQRLKSLVI